MRAKSAMRHLLLQEDPKTLGARHVLVNADCNHGDSLARRRCLLFLRCTVL